jgi:hypothetical protein
MKMMSFAAIALPASLNTVLAPGVFDAKTQWRADPSGGHIRLPPGIPQIQRVQA